MLFTTSWDDGYALDLRVAQLLERYGLTGTFYVCPRAQHGAAMLGEEQIRDLSQRHEIGAHTMTHPKLTQVTTEDARREIVGSKQWVEQVTGKPCTMFCYPKGAYNAEIRKLVAEAGFAGARTVESWRFAVSDPYAMPVSLQVMPFPWRRSFRPLWKVLDPLGPLRANLDHLGALKVPMTAWRSWLALAKAMFDGAQARGEAFFHLYGHSHEVERYGMWGELERFLGYVRASGFQSMANGALPEKK